MSETIKFGDQEYALEEIESVARSRKVVRLVFKGEREPVSVEFEDSGDAADEYIRLFGLIGKSDVGY